jgi:glycosyltransferase involved in cell wall biosynthesis
MVSKAGLRVMIDGTMARGGGGFTYLVNVMPRLAARSPEHRFRLLLRSPRLAAAIPPAPNLETELLSEAGFAGRLRFIGFEAARLARAWGADLYFSAGETAALGAPCPSIASFRNPNVFTVVPDGWPLRQRLRLRLLRDLARLSARTCDRILFVSADSASWIGDRLGLASEKRVVVHHGIDPTRWTAAAKPPVHPWPYVLSVSSIYRYKNFVKLIEAYTQLARSRRDAPDLVILGDDQDPEYSRKMQAARAAAGELAEHIHLIGEVPYADVPAWYAGAELFVFPSYLETFGHPLLEAMASSVPVVAADIPVFREIAEDAAFYADPHDAGALARAMQSALESPLARETLVKRGRERVRALSWDRTAGRLVTLFQEVVAASAEAGRQRAAARKPRRLGLLHEPVRSPAGASARAALS